LRELPGIAFTFGRGQLGNYFHPAFAGERTDQFDTIPRGVRQIEPRPFHRVRSRLESREGQK